MFYLLEDSNDIEIVGAYPQYEKFYPENEINSYLTEDTPKLLSNKFIDFGDAKMPDFIMRSHAKKTDMLTNGSIYKEMGMLLNNSFKKNIEKLKLPKHKFYPINVYSVGGREKIDEYYYFHPIIEEPIVRFEESVFEHVDFMGNTVQRLNFTNINDFTHSYNEILSYSTLDSIVPVHLSIVEEYKELDLFFVDCCVVEFIVSQNFLNMIENNKLTGCMINSCGFTIS